MVLSRLICPALLLVAGMAFGQPGRALRVKVLDSAGVSIADARVAIDGSKRSIRTDSAGRATLTGLPNGQLFLSIRRLGFVAVDSFAVAPSDSVVNVRLVDQ